jgi:hypothetical protein
VSLLSNLLLHIEHQIAPVNLEVLNSRKQTKNNNQMDYTTQVVFKFYTHHCFEKGACLVCLVFCSRIYDLFGIGVYQSIRMISGGALFLFYSF